MSQAVQAHVSRKSKRLTHESATRFVTRCLVTRGNRWEFKHLIRNSMGNAIWLIHKGKYFETWTFYEIIVWFFSRREPGLPVELYEYREKYILSSIQMTIILSKISSFFAADPCHHYWNLSEANRNTKHETSSSSKVFCDKPLADGWYRFVGAAGTKMPTRCRKIDVVQFGQAGWMVNILQWNMMKFTEGSALEIVELRPRIANTQEGFLSKTVDLTIYIIFMTHPSVTLVTVVQTKCEAKKIKK